MSQPTRAAWIEISSSVGTKLTAMLSQPTRAAWIEIIMCDTRVEWTFGRSPLGLRGLKLKGDYFYAQLGRRSPLGLRGLKCDHHNYGGVTQLSQPTRAAWIEIAIKAAREVGELRRSPLGLRGLKYVALLYKQSHGCRSPLGLRGLK